eukprot:CAMPEP_0202918368 /NCGR_PEP_ID=MMETSP1392-20130828/73261_1 /ASSEMBLY_ACC=CAM_ASM_000868 /TAXON_ID=225041 /ORGANISM="Chlamydomonas chlamydogama, Strain SAG 11-48b" /LENGTH=292 /DNA_ID=CAMNT_0049611405 /DNA_START=237 /DNA_END=1115 /DNA_ORIENTATION=-
MASLVQPGVLSGKEDLYGGFIIDHDSVPHEPAAFASTLKASIDVWRSEGKHGIWLKIPRDRSTLIPEAVQQGFDFHHADAGHVMMTLWLPDTPSTLPPNASHQVGVGALVINSRGQMLAVQERSGPLRGRKIWKMPTGLVHAGEDLIEAAQREVEEETGVRAVFDCVLLIRQAHGFAFGKSDIFVLCALKPDPDEQVIVHQESEIEAADWIPLAQYTSQEFMKGVALYQTLTDKCVSYAQGTYRGLRAAKLEASLPMLKKPRVDLLIWGEDDAAQGQQAQGPITRSTHASCM